MDNANSPEYLNKIKNSVIENLSRTKFAPSTQMTDVPPDIVGMDDEADAEMDDLDEDDNPDTRRTQRRWDKYVERDGELSDSEDEEENLRNGVLRQPGATRRRNIMDYQNPNAVPDDSMKSPTTSSSTGQDSNANGVAPTARPATSTTGEAVDNSKAEPASNGAIVALPDEDIEMGDGQDEQAPAMAVEQSASNSGPVQNPPTAQQASRTSNDIPHATNVEIDDASAAVAGQGSLAAKEDAANERTEANTNAEANTEVAKATDAAS